jgi:hypothetical protein
MVKMGIKTTTLVAVVAAAQTGVLLLQIEMVGTIV